MNLQYCLKFFEPDDLKYCNILQMYTTIRDQHVSAERRIHLNVLERFVYFVLIEYYAL